MASKTKQKMVWSTAALLRERSTEAVTIDAVLTASGAPRGSVYHHFPDGRNQLIREAVRAAGSFIDDLLTTALQTDEPATMIRQFGTAWRNILVSSNFRAGCPIVAVTVDQPDAIPGVADDVREIFGGWRERLSAELVQGGRDPVEARQVANLILSSFEGAIVLCRAAQSTVPLDDVTEQLALLVDAKHA